MHSDDDHPAVLVRPMTQTDRAIIAGSVVSMDTFNKAEVVCAPEQVDIYLNAKIQADYHIVVAKDAASRVHAYACWDSIPLTGGTHDLCWIATRPDSRNKGFGRVLMDYVESKAFVFCPRLGFEETSRIKDFYEVGDDRLIFVKRLS